MATDPQKQDERVEVSAKLKGAGGAQPIPLKNSGGGDSLSQPGAFSHEHAGNTFVAMLSAGTTSVKWKDITSILVTITLSEVDDVSFTYIKIIAQSRDGGPEVVLVDQNYAGNDLVIARGDAEPLHDEIILPAAVPPAALPPPSKSAEEIEDEAKRDELIDHLRHHKAHYSRAILLSQNTADRATALDAIVLPDATTLLDKVENRPIEVIGDYLAYPCADSQWEATNSRCA